MRNNNVICLLNLLILIFVGVVPMNVSAQKTTEEDLTVEFRVYADGKRVQTNRDLVKMFFATGPADMDEEEKKEFLQNHSDKFFEKYGEEVLIKGGQSAQLKVEMIEKDGTITDVTSSPNIIYEGYDPEFLSVNKKGMVTATFELHSDQSILDNIRIIFHHGDKLGYDNLMITVID